MYNLAEYKKIFASIFILGFCVFLSQIVVIRELFVIFYGNELSLGIIFFFWLLGNGLGSLLSKKIIFKLKNPSLIFAVSQIFLFFILFVIIFLIKSGIILNKPAHGEIIGPATMILNSFIFITPFCLLTGFLFPLACQIENTFLNKPAKSVGYTYMLDALGAGFAGIIGSLILIKFLSTWHIVFIIGVILILNCVLIYYFIFNRFNIALAILCLCITLSIFRTNFIKILDDVNLKLHWQGYKVLASESSIYGQITVLEKENNISFYNNGLYAFTYPDKLSAEEIHLTALQNIEAKNALVVGGGLNGSLAELLKYKNIEEIIYVELDPLIINLAKKLLPKEAVPSRISIINTDGRAFIKNTAKKFDLVIMNLPEPYTSSLNRFYTLEFFKEVKKILSPNGVFSLTLPSGENYISPEQKKLLAGTYHTLKNVFSETEIIPNGTNIFLSSQTKGQITLNGLILGERLKTVGSRHTLPLHLSFLSPDQLPFRLSQDRINQLSWQLQSPQPLNKDFFPINYFYDLLLWSSRVSSRLVKIVLIIERVVTIENILGFIFTIGLALLFLAKTKKTNFIPLSIMSAGFTGISLELIISLVFQIVTGYLYFHLGLILAGFMMGLACGSYFLTKSIEKVKNLNKTFNCLFLILAFYPIFLILCFYFFIENTGNINIIVFLSILFIPSFIIGGLFPLANKISIDKNDDRIPFGRLYACDLFGSAFGALLTASIFIPLLGIYFTLVIIACINIILLSLLVFRNTINHCKTNIA
ncbi:MAG: fused MFS/spermidine synthase [bacterium]